MQREDTDATSGLKEADSKLAKFNYGLKTTAAVLELYFTVNVGPICSQPSKGGSQWSSSTLLQTEVDLALE